MSIIGEIEDNEEEFIQEFREFLRQRNQRKRAFY